MGYSGLGGGGLTMMKPTRSARSLRGSEQWLSPLRGASGSPGELVKHVELECMNPGGTRKCSFPTGPQVMPCTVGTTRLTLALPSDPGGELCHPCPTHEGNADWQVALRSGVKEVVVRAHPFHPRHQWCGVPSSGALLLKARGVAKYAGFF